MRVLQRTRFRCCAGALYWAVCWALPAKVADCATTRPPLTHIVASTPTRAHLVSATNRRAADPAKRDHAPGKHKAPNSKRRRLDAVRGLACACGKRRLESLNTCIGVDDSLPTQ